MRAITISGGNLVRIALVAGFIALAFILCGLAALLAFAGYILFLVGTTKGAMAVWAAACIPLVLIGVTGTLVAPRIRQPHGTFTPTHTGVTP